MAFDSSLCCLCLKTSDFLLDIFEENSGNETIATIISQHFWFDVKKDERLTKSACIECWSNVDNFHKFYEQVNTAHKYFYATIHNENKHKVDEPAADQDLPPQLPEDLAPEIRSPIKSERASTEDATDCNFENIETPINVELTEDVATTTDSSDSDKPIIRRKSKFSKRKRPKSREIDPADHAKIEEENNQIRVRFMMECEQCNFQFDTFNDAQFHYRTKHRIHGYIRCCNTKFKSRPTVVEHLQRHLNPEEFKCDQCNKTFVNKRALAIHIDRHLSVEERPFKCTECPKSYIRRFLLERHMESHKNIPKSICDDCGKGFSNNITLSIHKRNVHERSIFFICDVCAKEFRNKFDFVLHHRNVHDSAPQPKIQCKVCGTWLKTKQSLRQHMVRHQDTKVMHSCNECDESFQFRWALRNHIRTLHTKILYDCSLCDKKFKRSTNLKEHMATHTGVSLYQCQFCPKTFNSSANMSSHRKKEHKNEREEFLKLKAAGLA